MFFNLAWRNSKRNRSAVSYTHLDVYKRQLWGLAMTNLKASRRRIPAEYAASLHGAH